ncbi:MAG: hypothetical protein RR232_05310 [Clostridia bacterium]
MAPAPAGDATTPAAAPTTGDTAAPAQQATGGLLGGDFLNWFQIALAAYLLYCVVTGRGKLFDNKYVKGDPKKYHVTMRILCGVSGTILLATSILELTGVVTVGSPFYWINWGVGFASIIALLAYNLLKTDRAAAAEATKQAQAEYKRSDPLKAAFVFDDEDDADKKKDETTN